MTLCNFCLFVRLTINLHSGTKLSLLLYPPIDTEGSKTKSRSRDLRDLDLRIYVT